DQHDLARREPAQRRDLGEDHQDREQLHALAEQSGEHVQRERRGVGELAADAGRDDPGVDTAPPMFPPPNAQPACTTRRVLPPANATRPSANSTTAQKSWRTRKASASPRTRNTSI